MCLSSSCLGRRVALQGIVSKLPESINMNNECRLTLLVLRVHFVPALIVLARAERFNSAGRELIVLWIKERMLTPQSHPLPSVTIDKQELSLLLKIILHGKEGYLMWTEPLSEIKRHHWDTHLTKTTLHSSLILNRSVGTNQWSLRTSRHLKKEE